MPAESSKGVARSSRGEKRLPWEWGVAAAFVVCWLLPAEPDIRRAGLGVCAVLGCVLVFQAAVRHRLLRLAQGAHDQSKRLVRSLQNQHQALLSVLPSSVFQLDADGHVTALSGAGLSGGGEREANLAELFPEGACIQLAQLCREVLQSGVTATCELSEMRGAEQLLHSVRVAPYRADSVVVSFRDAYALARLEAELRKARDTAYEAARLKTQFLATMSHEIRTPMNGVIGMTTLLMETELSPEQQEYAQIIQRSGKALLLVIDDILDFAKIEAGKLQLDELAFDLHACVDACLEAVASLAESKRLELSAVFDADVPVLVMGDPTRLRQILANLLSNAVRFSDSGAVRVRVRKASSGRIAFSVTDTGPGIAEERLPGLFQPVLLGERADPVPPGGTGLGLAITRELVTLMGGDIQCRSALGRGTEFQFELALSEQAEPLDSAAHPQVEAGAWVLVTASTAAFEGLSAQLTVLGVRAVAAGGSDVQTTLDAQPGPACTLWLLDMREAGDVYEPALRALRNDPRYAGLGLVVVASPQMEPPDWLRSEAVRVLTWPVRQADLAACLSALSRHERSPLQPAPAQSPHTPLHVLIADDDAIHQRVLQRMLARIGCTSESFVEGRRAVEAALSGRFDAVLMDRQMPDLDGFDAAREIRAREGARRNLIVAMTGSTSDEDRQLSRQAGMDAFLSKPVSIEQLGAALAQASRSASHAGVQRSEGERFHVQAARALEAVRAAFDIRDAAAAERALTTFVRGAESAGLSELVALGQRLLIASGEGSPRARDEALDALSAAMTRSLRRLRAALDVAHAEDGRLED